MQAQRHLWDQTWFRDMLALALALVALWVIYAARAVTTPALIGLGLAYVVNPLVTWDENRRNRGRWQSTTAIMVAGILAVTGLVLYVLPKLVGQLADLISSLPGYLTRAAEWLDIDWNQVSMHAEQVLQTQTIDPGAAATTPVENLAYGVDFQALAGTLARWFGAGIGLVGSAMGLVTYLGISLVVIAFCYFGFSCALHKIGQALGMLVPAPHREQTFRIAGRMDRTVSAFVRGRLIQSLVMGIVLSVGWWLAGVPYWLLLGLLAGFLNLVPFAASVGWIIAVLLTWLDCVTSGAGFSFWHVLAWPTLVYILAQGLDGWVIEPVVQGKATELDPLTVLLAVLVGGSVAGVLGLMLAIPVTACVKILIEELLVPKLATTTPVPTGPNNPDAPPVSNKGTD